MIDRKKQKGNEYIFWKHYHRIIDISYEGNDEVHERMDSYGNDELKRLYASANIPEKYFDFEFEAVRLKNKMITKNEDELAKLKKYMNGFPNAAKKGTGLFISGPHGIAKTTLAVIVLKLAIKNYYRCFFWKTAEIIEFIKSGWKNDYRRIFFDYVINNVDFLVIDDVARLFEINNTNTERLYIDQIFTKRDDRNKATILTANHDLDEESNIDLFGDALLSNFRERLIQIRLRGADYRNVIGDQLLEEL